VTTTGATAATTTSPVFVCVDATGKSAEIRAFASQEAEFGSGKRNLIGSNSNSRYGDKLRYSAATRAFARSTSPVVVTSTTVAAISQPSQATLTATGCSSALSVTYVSSTNGTTTTTTSWNPSTTTTFQPLIYPASPNTNAALTISGMTFSNPNTTDSSVTFTNGSCVVTANLSTP
jgi:hypothetical protein